MTPRHFDRPITPASYKYLPQNRAKAARRRESLGKKSAFSIVPRPVSHCILQCCLRPVYISSGFKLIFPSAAAPSFLIVSPYFARFCGLMRSGSLKSRYSFHFTASQVMTILRGLTRAAFLIASGGFVSASAPCRKIKIEPGIFCASLRFGAILRGRCQNPRFRCATGGFVSVSAQSKNKNRTGHFFARHCGSARY